MGHQLSPLRRALSLGLLLAACAQTDGVGPRQPSHLANESPSTALAPDGSAISLPVGAPLDHLDDGVPFIAGTGLTPSKGGRFGEPPLLGESSAGVLLMGGRDVLIRKGYDAIQVVSPDTGAKRWEATIEYLESAVASPDGAHVAVVAEDELLLFDAAKGSRKVVSSGVRRIAFSRDGALLAAGPRERGDVVIFDVKTGKEVKRLSEPGYGATFLAFSPNGKRLATTDGGGSVRVWEIARGRTVYLGRTSGGPFAWADDHTLLFGDDDGEISRADVDAAPRAQPPERVLSVPGKVRGIHPVPGSSRFLIELERTFASLVDLPSKKEIARLQGTLGAPWSIAPDGSAAASFGARVAVYDLKTLAPRAQAAGHLDAVTAIAERSGRVVTGSSDGSVMSWDGASKKPLARRMGLDGVLAVDVASGTGAIAAATDKGDVLVFDDQLKKRIVTLSVGEPGEYTSASVAIAGDGKTLVAAGGKRSVLYDLEKGAIVAAYPFSFRTARFTPELVVVGPSPLAVLRRRDGAELRRDRSRSWKDGFALGVIESKYVVVAESGEYRSSIFLLGGRAKEQRREGGAFSLGEPLAFSPDGTRLASGSSELEILATADGAALAKPKLASSGDGKGPLRATALAFGTDGKHVLVGYERGFAEAVPAPAYPKPNKTLAPGFDRASLPPLADLTPAARATGPRDVALRPLSTPSRRAVLPHSVFALSPDGSRALLGSGADVFLHDLTSGKTGEALFVYGVRKALAGPKGLFFLEGSYEEPSRILGGPAPLETDKSCRDGFPVDPGTYFCTSYSEVMLKGARSQKAKVKLDWISDRAVAENGTVIVLATGSEVVILSAKTLEVIARVPVASADDIALSEDGRALVVAAMGVVLLIDTGTGKVIRILEGHDARRVAISTDGRRIASVGEELVRVWDASDGRVVAVLDTGGSADMLSFRPDGRAVQVAVGREVTTWDLP
ncbi:MAG: WD40 repeat domain-containing protein [Myxococcales bacterium]|nr:WD40 repeat domain-containing protein [Myxococcales bacterium]